MLTIYPQTSAADVKKYFDVADYYSEGQETVGQWGGKLAERLGLSGRVTKDAFGLLCDNINPATGGPLTPRTNDDRRVGYDFTFSGPKSYSILVGLAPSEEERQRLRAAFDASVAETMAEIEADMQCRVRVKGADHDRTTGNMAWAAFHHSTSRPVDSRAFLAGLGPDAEVPGWLLAADGTVPPDMQEHTHVFAFNATEDPQEGRIKAGQFANLKRDGEYYTAAFYARLAGKLQDMGYVIDRRGGKEWEVAGITQGMIDKFNKRSAEIEVEHRRRLRDDPDYRAEYKHELAAKTRAKKQKALTPEQLRSAWDAQNL